MGADATSSLARRARQKMITLRPSIRDAVTDATKSASGLGLPGSCPRPRASPCPNRRAGVGTPRPPILLQVCGVGLRQRLGEPVLLKARRRPARLEGARPALGGLRVVGPHAHRAGGDALGFVPLRTLLHGVGEVRAE